MLTVPALPAFDESNWDAIAAAFQNAPHLSFGQAWLPQPEEKFRGGEVFLGWRDDAIHVLARLQDDDVYSTATADQEYMWQLGDVFEMFFRDSERQEYFELHTTPSGHRLQLSFPSEEVFTTQVRTRLRSVKEFFVTEPLFDFRLRKISGGWEVKTTTPYRHIFPGQNSPEGRELRASFGRYDFTQGVEKPVVSSTSAHEKVDFHRLSEWEPLRFVG